MTRHVALLRGVNNAGMAKRVAMSDLRVLFEGLGYRDVRTLLNSGNVVFSMPAGRAEGARARIEKALASRLGLTTPVIVLPAAEVVAAVRDNPLGQVADNPSHLLVLVMSDPAHRKRLEPLLKQRWAPERLALGRRVAYLWCPNGVSESELWPRVERALEKTGTARNMGTMTKLMALVQGEAS